MLADKVGVGVGVHKAHADEGVGLLQALGQVGHLAVLDAVVGVELVVPVGLLGADEVDGGLLVHALGHVHGLVGQGIEALGGQVDVHGGEPLGKGGDHHVQDDDDGDEHHGHQGGNAAALDLIHIEQLFPRLLLLLFFFLLYLTNIFEAYFFLCHFSVPP